MEFIYPFLISFSIVFVTELGDKTQLLVLSLSNKIKTISILMGVAVGSFFSHGLAIIFGSTIGMLHDSFIHNLLEIVTYCSFIILGILSLIPKKEKLIMSSPSKKAGIMNKLSNLNLSYFIIIALSIMVGEIGDKTFLASIGLGISYPETKIPLILGAISAMVVCDSIAILFGKLLGKHLKEESMQKLSGVLFLIFGLAGFIF